MLQLLSFPHVHVNKIVYNLALGCGKGCISPICVRLIDVENFSKKNEQGLT